MDSWVYGWMGKKLYLNTYQREGEVGEVGEVGAWVWMWDGREAITRVSPCLRGF